MEASLMPKLTTEEAAFEAGYSAAENLYLKMIRDGFKAFETFLKADAYDSFIEAAANYFGKNDNDSNITPNDGSQNRI